MQKRLNIIIDLLLLTFLLSFNIFIIESKITRKHKHPGSQLFVHPDIQIEPLNKNDINNINNYINIFVNIIYIISI